MAWARQALQGQHSPLVSVLVQAIMCQATNCQRFFAVLEVLMKLALLQGLPRSYASPMQQQQLLRIMLAQQAQQQRLQSAQSMQYLRRRQLQQRQRDQQMWGAFF